MPEARSQKLKGKKILITAGPTWVALDSVRVISNIASGETGIKLAEKMQKLGAKVTLFLGPVAATSLNNSITVIHFRYFDELRNKIIRELKERKFDSIIHSAAVSDFKPLHGHKGKLPSHKNLTLRLTALPKIVSDIKKLCGQAKLVIFKLEINVSKKTLLGRARKALQAAGAEIVVANSFNPYRAVILTQDKAWEAKNKNGIVNTLLRVLH
ncbi:MAG: phosphopantothenoylcysteine decarboxylase [Candidatus Omnitrophota bacterium]|jgi:phosphopantothenoylcysteine decarboxylase/phosphopantothenate--cysteine ligase